MPEAITLAAPPTTWPGGARWAIRNRCSRIFIDVYGRLGETELTLDWLEEAYGQRRPHLTSLGVDPLWDPLRSHPRFGELMNRLNLPQAARSGAPG